MVIRFENDCYRQWGPLHSFKHVGNMNRFKELVGVW